MATADEVLKEMDNVSETNNDSPVCIIDPETRTITVPPEYQLLGVESDEKVERLYFQCPKIVGDNVDLSQLILFINYQNAGQEIDAYKITDVETDGDNITFSWLLDRKVTAYRTTQQNKLGFSFCAQKADEDGTLTQEWNTTVNTECSVLEGLEAQEHVEEENSAAIAQIWQAIDELKAGGGGSGGTTNYNNLSNKPQLNGVTLEGNKTLDQVGVLAKNQGASNSGKYLSVGSDGNVVPTDAPSGGTVDPEQIKQAVNDYLEEHPVSGMTATVKNAFLECFANVAWATAEGQACYDKLKTALNESVGEIKLSSITATCSETAQIGTAASDLDIVVTAIYSDGSSAQVTGWTTSGTVVEGTNTFVVSYGGKNTTVTVTGVDLYYVLNKASNKSEIMSSNSYSDGGETGAGFPSVYLAWHLWGSKVVEQDTAVKIKYIPSEINYNGVFAYCINPETFTIDRKKYYAVQLATHALVDTSYEWEYTIKAGYAFGISLGSNSPVPTVEVVS